MGNTTSSATTLNAGISQSCVLIPLLCFKPIIKFVNDVAAVRLISNNYESAYRKEMEPLAQWFKDSNMSLKMDETRRSKLHMM